MKIINDELRREFTEAGRCEYCGRKVPTECAHVFAKGFGGGRQLDIRINLIALDRECHANHHSGVILTESANDGDPSLLAKVAVREKCYQHHIREVIWFLRRIDKHDSDEKIQRKLAELEPGPRALAQRVLEEVRRS